jgi:hypothetical protein
MQRLLGKENAGQLGEGFRAGRLHGNVYGNIRILPATLIVGIFGNYGLNLEKIPMGCSII